MPVPLSLQNEDLLEKGGQVLVQIHHSICVIDSKFLREPIYRLTKVPFTPFVVTFYIVKDS